MARALMPAPRFAIVTPSYRGDVERCKLLCASIDHFVSGLSTHYLLVEDRDLPMFRPLAGPKRRVLAESELFPRWLVSRPDPLSLGRRRIWTGAGALARGLMPLRGWHTQQLRKLALPAVAGEEVLLYADSDSFFVRPYDLASQFSEGKARLLRKPGGITADMAEHVGWTRHAAGLLGLEMPALPADDYIDNLPTWTRSNVQALKALIEARSGRHWISAVARQRSFSEMMIYGLHADRVAGADSGHAPTPLALSRTLWTAADLTPRLFEEGSGLLAPHHVSIGVQSFIGTPMETLWDMFRRAAARA
jgi:hypothetical protein